MIDQVEEFTERGSVTRSNALTPDAGECTPALGDSSVAAAHRAALRANETQLKEAHRRLQALCSFAALLAQQHSSASAMRLAGLSATKRSHLERDLRAAGLPLPGVEVPLDLLPRYIAVLTPGISAGRPPKYPLTETEALTLRGLALAKSTQDALHFAIAVEEFANHPACRAETRTLIIEELDRAARLRRAPQWPVAIRRAGYPSLQEAAAFRGRKHAQEVEQVDRRGLFWIDEDNQRRPLLAHTIWEMDDASDNEPRRSIDPDTGKNILTRQALWTQDVFSAALLGVTQVARPRDSYRIEDVADHVLRCVESCGLPEIMRLEMGEIWNGQFFHGFVPMIPGTRQILPGWPEGETWGSLSPLCRVINVFKSKGKGGIEGSFNLVQAIAAHRSLSIGRSRGEFEDATTALIRSNRTGEIDERFWDMDTSSEAMKAVAERFNLRPKIRRCLGRDAVAPADLLRDSKGLPLLASERWRFCPVKRLATVRGGHVEIRVDHYPVNFRFRVNGVDDQLHLDHGYQVLVAFHPGRPEEGCHIFNAELGVRNRDGLKRAERILLAPFAADAPQVDLSGRSDFSGKPNFGPRKKAAAAVRRNFRAIGKAVRADYAQSSDGRHLLVEHEGDQRKVTSQPAMEGRSENGEGEPQITSAALPAPARADRRSISLTATQEEFERQSALLARLAAINPDTE